MFFILASNLLVAEVGHMRAGECVDRQPVPHHFDQRRNTFKEQQVCQKRKRTVSPKLSMMLIQWKQYVMETAERH
jgi:hypothetical protein